MKVKIIFYSYSGITRGVAEKVRDACGGDLLEVTQKSDYSRLTAYTLGCYRALKGICDPIDPETIDGAADDVIVIGTPVWAGRAAPAVNAAVAALAGCKGKKAVIFATCGGKEGDTLPMLKKALGEKGVNVVGEFVFTPRDLKDRERLDAVVAAIRSAGSTQ